MICSTASRANNDGDDDKDDDDGGGGGDDDEDNDDFFGFLQYQCNELIEKVQQRKTT